MADVKMTAHRVQVNLPEYLYRLVKREAFEKNTSISGFIREAVKKQLGTEEMPSTDSAEAWNRFMENYLGSIEGEKDDSLTHDRWAAETGRFHER